MLEYVTGFDIAVEAKMIRTAFSGTILIVEGDDDILFLQGFTNEDQCMIIAGWGKQNVLTAIDLLEKEGLFGYLGIVDADFWNIMGIKQVSKNICVTDHHDIEIMIIETQALFCLLKEHGSKEKIRIFLENKKWDIQQIRGLFYSTALPIGILRLISLRRKLGLNFNKIKYDKIIHRDDLSININRVIINLLKEAAFPIKVKELCDVFYKEIEKHKNIENSQVCCGDDIIAIICIALRKTLGTHGEAFANRKNISSALRLAYDSNDLRTSTLYHCMRNWEEHNPPYLIFNF
jgi:hypothetical protein